MSVWQIVVASTLIHLEQKEYSNVKSWINLRQNLIKIVLSEKNHNTDHMFVTIFRVLISGLI